MGSPGGTIMRARWGGGLCLMMALQGLQARRSMHVTRTPRACSSNDSSPRPPATSRTPPPWFSCSTECVCMSHWHKCVRSRARSACEEALVQTCTRTAALALFRACNHSKCRSALCPQPTPARTLPWGSAVSAGMVGRMHRRVTFSATHCDFTSR